MTFLYIVLSLLGFFGLFSLIPFTLDIRMEDELSVTAKIGFIPFRLTPKKEKPLRLRDYRIGAFRKRRLKEERRYRKRLLKESRKKGKGDKAESSAPKPSLVERGEELLSFLRRVVLRAGKTFGRHLRVDWEYLYVTVGGDAPDKTAIVYGTVSQGLSYLQAWLHRHCKVRYRGKRAKRPIVVGVDFLSPAISVRGHLAFTVRVWQVLSIGKEGLLGHLEMLSEKPKGKATSPMQAGGGKTASQVPQAAENVQ